MRRAILAVAALGIVALAAASLLVRDQLAFTLGVISSRPGPFVHAGQTACQRPIAVPADAGFDRVNFEIGTDHRPQGPPVEVVVRDLDRPSEVRRGLLRAGYPDVGVQQRQVVRVGPVRGGTRIAVCFTNRGPHRVALFGGPDGSDPASTATLDGSAVGFDFDLVFERDSRTYASLIPAMARRASLFRPPWVSPALYYALLALLLIGVPLLLARAVSNLD